MGAAGNAQALLAPLRSPTVHTSTKQQRAIVAVSYLPLLDDAVVIQARNPPSLSWGCASLYQYEPLYQCLVPAPKSQELVSKSANICSVGGSMVHYGDLSAPANFA